MRKKIGIVLILAVLIGVFAAVLFGGSITDIDEQKKFTQGYGSDFTHGDVTPYQVDEPSASVTYIRYRGGSGEVFIQKVSVAGTVTTFEKTKDTWANRATATYVPINQ